MDVTCFSDLLKILHTVKCVCIPTKVQQICVLGDYILW